MIRRLVEQHYFQHRNEPTPEQIRFWLRDLRTARLLLSVVQVWPLEADDEAGQRLRRLPRRIDGSEERVAEHLGCGGK